MQLFCLFCSEKVKYIQFSVIKHKKNQQISMFEKQMNKLVQLMFRLFNLMVGIRFILTQCLLREYAIYLYKYTIFTFHLFLQTCSKPVFKSNATVCYWFLQNWLFLEKTWPQAAQINPTNKAFILFLTENHWIKHHECLKQRASLTKWRSVYSSEVNTF